MHSLLLFTLLGISAFFAACEVAFLSFPHLRLHSLVEKNISGAQSLMRLKHNRRKVVISLLIGNNVANIAASTIATSWAIALFGDSGLGISVGVMSFLILTFGDIAPKSFATTHGEKIMLLAAPVLEAFYFVSYPLVLVFEAINRAIPGVYSRATGIEQFTEEELKIAIKLGAEHHSISDKEKKTIENVLAFNDKTVGEVMKPKSKVFSLPAEMPSAVAHAKAVASTYSRFPVIKGEKVIGTVNLRSLSKATCENPAWQVEHLIWPPIRILRGAKLNEAFTTLKERGRKTGIVVDANNEYIGIITIEDLLEALVGEMD